MDTIITTQSNEAEVDQWEHELDALGVFAKLEDLEAHLAKAPVGARSLTALSDHIAAARLSVLNLQRPPKTISRPTYHLP